jgi:hypothetical protein
LQSSKKHKNTTMQKLIEPSFDIELTLNTDVSFYDALLIAIDEAFLSLGEQARETIYFHLGNTMGIKKQEIPFRIYDFQNALEKIFGIGARSLEIMILKHLHKELKTTYKWNMPRWVIPDITFQEYLRKARKDYEKSNNQEVIFRTLKEA